MEVHVYQYAVCEWQYMLQFKIDGPSVLEWELSPMNIELMKHLLEQEGGDKALPYWGGSIRDSRSELIMKRIW